MRPLLVIITAAALAFAGCLGGAEPTDDSDQAAPVEPAGGASASADGGTDAAVAPGLALGPGAPLAATPAFFTADGAIAAVAPDTETVIPLGFALNSPMVSNDEYPQWMGTLDRDINASSISVPFTFYVSTSSVTGPARHASPVMGDLPGADIVVWFGDSYVDTWVTGPDIMAAGEVYEFSGTLDGEDIIAYAGDMFHVELHVYYGHVQGASEFRVHVGGEHASTITVPAGTAPIG